MRSDGASSEAADIVSTSIDNEMEGTMSNGPLADAPDLSLVDLSRAETSMASAASRVTEYCGHSSA